MYIYIYTLDNHLTIYSVVTFSTLIELYHEMMLLFGLSHDYWYYHELLKYVQSIHDRKVILTGHSLGGGIARYNHAHSVHAFEIYRGVVKPDDDWVHDQTCRLFIQSKSCVVLHSFIYIYIYIY